MPAFGLEDLISVSPNLFDGSLWLLKYNIIYTIKLFQPPIKALKFYFPILLKSSRINTRIADCETIRYSTFSTLISMDALFKYSA